MRINNNIMAMNTHRQYSINNASVAKSVEKLSSGYRINRAGDDAAGLAISEKMRAQIRGLSMASKNSQDAVSLIQTAEGALQSTHNILQRMRELAVQSSSDTNETTIDRGALEQEFQALKAEINDIAGKTRFNDQNLIDGTFNKFSVGLDGTYASATALGSGNLVRVTSTGAEFGTFTIGITGQDATATNTSGGTTPTGDITKSGVGDTATAGGTSVTGATYKGPATSAFNGNLYTLKIETVSSETGAEKIRMTMLDSNQNVVGESGEIDLATWATTTATATKSVSFGDFGTIEFSVAATQGSTAIYNNLILSATGTGVGFQGADIQVTGGVDAVVTPAKEASATITINGEAVEVRKGDTSVTFRNSGLTLYFDGGLRDSDLGTGGLLLSQLNTKTVIANAVVGKEFVVQTGANEGDELSINIDNMNATSLGIQGTSIASQKEASRAITDVNNAVNSVSTQRAALGALQNRLEHKIANLDTSAENLQAAEARIRDLDMAKEMTEFTKNNILSQASTAMLAQANSLPQGVLQLLG